MRGIRMMIMKYIKKYFRSMSNVLVSQLFFEVTSFNVCPEIDGISDSESYMLYVVPQEATTECGQPEPKYLRGFQTVFYWYKIYVKVVIVC